MMRSAQTWITRCDIKVRIVRNGVGSLLPATPITTQVSDDQINFDSALLKVAASNLPHVTLGDWSEVDIDSQITILPSFPGPETLMLQGPISGKAPAQNGLGPKLVNTIWFQCPVRNGFSGAPIFSCKGHVVGIVDTKVFGISPALDSLRARWIGTQRGNIVIINKVGGIDIAESFLGLINDLNQNLISGLGNGVAIEYAKKQQATKEK